MNWGAIEIPWLDLAKIAASTAAILGLAGLSHWLGLGGDLRIRTVDQARFLASQAIDGFEAVDVALDRAGIGALLRDTSGRQLLLRRHGAAWVGRLLDSSVEARLDQGFLTIGTSEPTFGKVTLHLGDAAQVWAAGLRRLPAAGGVRG